MITIEDWAALVSLADFKPDYLRLRERDSSGFDPYQSPKAVGGSNTDSQVLATS